MSIPESRVNHELSVGIVNPYGQLWTDEAFPTPEAAETHLRSFWGGGAMADKDCAGFKLCVVRVELVPESEPFPLPSAKAVQP